MFWNYLHSREFPAKEKKMPSHTAQESKAAKTNVPDGFSPEAVNNLSSVLNAVLADVFALYLKTKNFHWHMSGPHFRDYHLLLDEQATQILPSAMTLPSAFARSVAPLFAPSATSPSCNGSRTTIRNLSPHAICCLNFMQTTVRWSKAFAQPMRYRAMPTTMPQPV